MPVYQNKRLHKRTPAKKIGAPKGIFVTAALLLVVAVLVGGYMMMQHRNSVTNTATDQNTKQAAPFDKSQFSLTDPTSPWVVVNKKRPLNPKTYEPADLRTPDIKVESNSQQVNGQTATALEALAKAAANEGVSLMLISGYRSYNTQVTIYESEVRGYGLAQADRESARPGYSEHQSGWAADLGAANGKCQIKACFADTTESTWLAANAYKYGFILRYAEGKESITGYMYEPWHLRYVGVELATQMHRTGIQTLEEFFGLPPASSYN